MMNQDKDYFVVAHNCHKKHTINNTRNKTTYL